MPRLFFKGKRRNDQFSEYRILIMLLPQLNIRWRIPNREPSITCMHTHLHFPWGALQKRDKRLIYNHTSVFNPSQLAGLCALKTVLTITGRACMHKKRPKSSSQTVLVYTKRSGGSLCSPPLLVWNRLIDFSYTCIGQHVSIAGWATRFDFGISNAMGAFEAITYNKIPFLRNSRVHVHVELGSS